MLGKKPTTRTGLALLALLVLGTGLLHAAEKPPEKPSEEPAKQAAADTVPEAATAVGVPGAMGMIVVIDEETGALRAPTTFELDAMNSQHEQYWLDGSDLETFTGAGNSVILKLDSRFHKYAVANAPEAGEATVQHDVLLVKPESPAEEPEAAEPAEEVAP